MRKRLPPSFYNFTTLIGASLSLVMLILIVFLIVLDATRPSNNNYMGLLTYIALPAVMIFGLLIALVGIMRTAKRLRKGTGAPAFPAVDLNIPRHRNLATAFGVGGLVFMALSGFGSYHAYEYTESVQFCGTTCHSVMEPEYTAYQNSPHAKVACASCHIGGGAQWYVRSKLSGSYQVYATLFNKYTKPIETPIHNLRPAKETCEQCHWPKHFYAQKLKTHNYFLSDEQNTPYQLSMLVKVGATEPGKSEGIHAHMYLNNAISYIATDSKRQIIPYVEARAADGTVTIYRDKDNPATPDALRKGERRTVDCIDCHNRPSHIFQHPEFSVNQAMAQGLIDPKLPEVKQTSVEALEKPYKTSEEAESGIAAYMRDFYKTSHPQELTSHGPLVEAAIRSLQTIYKENYFPKMRSSWKAFPNNLDHMHNSGCFRCHDDKHVSDTGKVISKNCQTCHMIIAQGKPGSQQTVSLTGQEFKHPMDVGDDWKTTPCKDCHGAEKG